MKNYHWKEHCQSLYVPWINTSLITKNCRINLELKYISLNVSIEKKNILKNCYLEVQLTKGMFQEEETL